MECRRYIEIKVSLCLCICLKRPAYFLGVLEWEGKRKEANISGVAWQRVGNPRVGWGGSWWYLMRRFWRGWWCGGPREAGFGAQWHWTRRDWTLQAGTRAS